MTTDAYQHGKLDSGCSSLDSLGLGLLIDPAAAARVWCLLDLVDRRLTAVAAFTRALVITGAYGSLVGAVEQNLKTEHK